MNKDLDINGYIVVDNFLEPQQAKNLYVEFKKIYKDCTNEFIYDRQCPNSPAIYDPYIFLDFLIKKIPFVSEMIGEDVYPTYCYARHYRNGADLKPHTDRIACEISVSVHLDGDGTPWELFFEKPNGEINGINLSPGQAVIYLGHRVKHWREFFTGQEYGQVFLHYVRAKGEYRWAYFDKKGNK